MIVSEPATTATITKKRNLLSQHDLALPNSGLPRSEQPPLAISHPAQPSFEQLGVPAELVRILAHRGITNPFPIQAASLPDSLAGRDVLGRGRTGSGKTVAFALPLLAALANSGRPRRPGKPRALILVPTRELAAQVHETVDALAQGSKLKTMTIFGGVGQGPQVTKLRNGVDVCIATPGRLEDLIAQRHCALSEVEVTVLDEADHMADLGFLPAVKRLLDQTPKGTQRLLFSATLDNGIDIIVRRYLNKPVTHSVDSIESNVPAMEHHVFQVQHDAKNAVVRELVSGQGRTLAFTRTKHGAKKLARQLTAAGIPAADLHGNLSPNARQRNLAAFGQGSVRVLVATDIAARGIHVDNIALVVHVDPPTEHKAYLHRSGRTARAGAEGAVVTVSTRDQSNDVRILMRKAAIKATSVAVAPGDFAITALTGPAAKLVTPALVQSAPQGNRNGSRGGANGRSAGNRPARNGSRPGGRGNSSGSRSGPAAGPSRTGDGNSRRRSGNRSAQSAGSGRSGGGAAVFSSNSGRRSR